jgi:polysaccharide export outer membrane protein
MGLASAALVKGREKNNQGSAGGQATPQQAGPAAADVSYTIGVDDVLDISVWKEPDVSRSVPVRPDGKISLPLINDVQAAGLTPADLATEITGRLKKFLNDPQVTVIVTQINSRRVYVVGGVVRAGAYPLLPGMTVLQAISSAGGFTVYADTKAIRVVRVVDGKQTELPFDYHAVLKGSKSSENILLLPGDTIVVPD